MNDLEPIRDLHQMAGEQADAGNWAMAQQGYELLAHKARLMALAAKQRADGSVARWNWCEAQPLPKLNPTNWRNHNSN